MISYFLVSVCFGITVVIGKSLAFPKYILFMGRISYSFFLIHYLICKIFTRLINIRQDFPLMILMICLCYLITIFISYIYDELINKCRSYIKGGKLNGGFDSYNLNKK